MMADPPPQQPRIAVPSAKDVRAAERQRAAVPNLFVQRQQQQLAAAPALPADPLAFVGGTGPPSAPPSQQQQQQQQQRWQQPYPPSQPQHQQLQEQPFHPPYQPAQAQHAQQQHQQQQPPRPSQQQQQQQSQARPPGLPQQQQQWQLLPPPQQQQAFPPNAIIVSRRQEGNPVLKHIRNVRWVFGDIVPDYMLGRETACLFLSLRFHMLKPDYIYHRIKELQRSYRLRIILCHVDTDDAVDPLAQVTRAAIGNDCTLICGWSNQECARYLETFKSYENKPAEVIQKDVGTDYVSRLTAALTTIRGVNKTDVKTLGDRFGSLAGILRASVAELQACPGIGPTKARRLYEAFHEPFRRTLGGSGGTGGSQQQAGGSGGAMAAGAAPGAAAGAAAHAVQRHVQGQEQHMSLDEVEELLDDEEEDEDDFV